jgi:2-methylcitrate dehydratase
VDGMTRRIAEYAAWQRFDAPPADVVEAATLRMVDSLACAIAAYGCDQAAIGLRLARGSRPDRYAGRILGCPERSTAEMATFVNTCLIRNLDFNDQYPSGHPSDCLGALLALAEATGAGGARLLASAVVAYELFIRLNDPTSLRDMGWDQGFILGVATAAATGNLLSLTPAQIGEAVAITAVANVPMRNTRAGELSLWKGAATAYAGRNGVFGALLAAEGMTGPDKPFEGRHGLWDLLTGPFELAPFPSDGGGYRIGDVNMKYWPVEYNLQLAVWAGLQLRERFDWRDLGDIDIGTYAFSHLETAGDPEKWDPQTRETADHSMAYVLARTIVDGTITAASFDETAFRDPALRPLMAKVRVHTDETLDALQPDTVAMTLAATSADGTRHEFELRDPLGHQKRPMQAGDVEQKFLRAAEPAFGRDRAERALALWSALADAADMGTLFDAVELPDPPG